MKTPDEIKINHPSICYNCDHARKPASNALQDEGYVGCAYPLIKLRQTEQDTDELDVSFIGEAKQLAEGWVDMRAKIFGNNSGITTNCQLLTLGVGDCSRFQKRSEN